MQGEHLESEQNGVDAHVYGQRKETQKTPSYRSRGCVEVPCEVLQDSQPKTFEEQVRNLNNTLDHIELEEALSADPVIDHA